MINSFKKVTLFSVRRRPIPTASLAMFMLVFFFDTMHTAIVNSYVALSSLYITHQTPLVSGRHMTNHKTF